MEATYLKCSHGIEFRSLILCQECEKEKKKLWEGLASLLNDTTKPTKIPIYRGCRNEVCYCTGKCREVIGYYE